MNGLSVIIPSYRSEKTLSTCLNSIFSNQRASGFPKEKLQIIVVDSSSEFQISKWQKEFPEVEFYHSPKQLFAGAARNRGRQYARHEWFSFLDSDCTWNPQWLESALKFTSEDPEIIAYSGPIFFDETSDLDALAFHITEFHEYTGEDFKIRFLPSGNLLIKASFFDRIGSYREDIPMCTDFTFTATIPQSELSRARYRYELSITHLAHEMNRDQLESKARKMGFWRGKIDHEIPESLQLKSKWWFSKRLLPTLFVFAIFVRCYRLKSKYRHHLWPLRKQIFKYVRMWSAGCVEGMASSQIVLIIDTLNAGGAEKTLSQLANELSDQNHRVKFLTFDRSSDPMFYALNKNIELIRLGDLSHRSVATLSSGYISFLRASLFRFFALRKVLNKIAKETSDTLVVSFMPQVNIITAAASIFLKIRLSVSERACPKYTAGFLGKILRSITYLRAENIVVQTSDAKHFLPRFLWSRIRVIPNAVRPENQNTRTPNQTNILSVGRLSEQKRFDRLIRIFAELSKKHKNLKLTILGEGPDRASLKQLAKELDIENKIEMPGIVKDPEAFYKTAEVFAMTSDYEGFPNALAEAMAHGIPVVAMDCPSGPSDMIVHETNGILVALGDEKQFATELEKILLNPVFAKNLGEKAKEIYQKYSSEKIFKLWKDFLKIANAKS